MVRSRPLTSSKKKYHINSSNIFPSGDTSIIMPCQNYFFFPVSNIMSYMSKWFTAIELAPNLDETNIMKFVTNHSQHYPLKTDYNKKHLEDYIKTKLLGLQTHNHMIWKNNIIKQMSASQADKYTCRHQHIVHFTKKTRQLCRIIRVILNQRKESTEKHCFYYAEKFLILKNDSSNYNLYIMNCLQHMNFTGKILINAIL